MHTTQSPLALWKADSCRRSGCTRPRPLGPGRGILFLLGALATQLSAQPSSPHSVETGAPKYETVVGMTAPRKTATLASVEAGRIAQIAVKEGDRVTAGDLLFTLDDGVQRARTEMSKAKASSTLGVDLSRARWDQAVRDLERLRGLDGTQNVSSKELNDAATAAEIARIEYEWAQFEQTQASLAYAYDAKVLARYTVRAPFDGYVAQRLKEAAETVDEQEGIVTLVQLDPLQVVLDCPLSLAPLLHSEGRVRVSPVDEHWSERWGTIELVHRVADGASQTFKVKIVVPNEDGRWMSGMKVKVEFSTHENPSQVPAPRGSEG